MFDFLLGHLAKRSCTLPDKAPLLEFLERCNQLIDKQVQIELNEWKNYVAKRLEIDLNAIRARIKPTRSSNQQLQFF